MTRIPGTAVFFASYHATYTGEGGPILPTGKETDSDYVLAMSKNNRVERMVKVWNAPWALRELGWID